MKVEDTVVKAPRCLNVASWSKVNDPISLKTSRGGNKAGDAPRVLSALMTIFMTLLDTVSVANTYEEVGEVPRFVDSSETVTQ